MCSQHDVKRASAPTICLGLIAVVSGTERRLYLLASLLTRTSPDCPSVRSELAPRSPLSALLSRLLPPAMSVSHSNDVRVTVTQTVVDTATEPECTD